MNQQGKGKIEYLDYTFNPVSGCNHPCKDSYCYAAKIARRFGGNVEHEYHGLHILDRPMYKRTKAGKLMVDPYPYGFEPTFHKYRLNEPAQIKKPSVIGVVYMGDLFGEWVPDEWIREVFNACEAAPQHTYIFLTKNPSRYHDLQFKIPLPPSYKYWYGATANCFNDFRLGNRAHYMSQLNGCKKFLSIEPLLNNIGALGLANLHRYDWIIIGQQTGPGAVPPKPEWVQSIIDQCRAANVPAFVKSPLYERFKIQEWPEGLRKEMER